MMTGCSHAALLWPSAAALIACCLVVTTTPAAGLYHSSQEVLHWFSHQAVKHPNVMRFHEHKDKKHKRVFLPVATITENADASPHRRKPVVLFVFGEHAREVITSEVALWLARLLTDSNSSIYSWPELAAALQRADAGGSSSSSSTNSSYWPAMARSWVQEVLQQLEVQVIPIEALDSRRLVESGELCVRKTSTNVDLNRNWPFAWHRADDLDEQYGGPAPFSEPQSRLVKQLIDKSTGHLLGYVNVHSGEWAMYSPWDSKPAYAPNLPADLPDLVDTVGRVCECMVGPAGAVSGYLAFGTSMDYTYVHKKVPYPLTVEVFGGGDIGKLRPGQTNQKLTEYKLLSAEDKELPAAATIATTAGRRTRALQAAWQQQRQQEHLQPPQQHWLGQVLSATWSKLLTPSQQQRNQQMHVQDVAVAQHEVQYTLHHHRRLQQLLPPSDQRLGGFTHGPNLSQLRQQMLQQLTAQQSQQQPSQPVAAASNAGGDLFLQLMAAAPPHVRSCFSAFNPTDEASYRRVVADWTAAFLVMLKHMADSGAAKTMGG